MLKSQAQNIVKETLQNDFNKERFVHFVKNLLNHIEDAPFVYRGNTIPRAYEHCISTFERIGKYSDGETKLDILIVKLKKETTLERARTEQRNFIAWYLNGSRGGEQKDAALVAFVAPNNADWRFSLVKMEYRFEEGKSGKIKIKEEYTPAKRWSFLVGANEDSHTAQSKLVPIIEDENVVTLIRLEEAFGIEKVTKEFFEKYRDLFLRVKDELDDLVKNDEKISADFQEKNVETANFAKKVLGQIVFLYFLQKKGWFGVPMDQSWGGGDKKFLRTLFREAVGKNKNYFNDYLEPLFYEALAKDRDEGYYSRFESKIPLLNGGLFDPMNNYDWVNTEIDLPNDIFSNDRKIQKTGDIGDGILDIFDRYNFTVKEDEPLEKEVAVDPEMLGKVFENLLEVKDRKSKGTYYTPREIVNYMCEQSTLNYLATELEVLVAKEDIEVLIKHGETVSENEVKVEVSGRETETYYYKLPESIRLNAQMIDDKLSAIKICDPAIGSGAFPVGMMNIIVKTRMVLNSYLCHSREGGNSCPDRTLYHFKRDCIQNSLYGVDIDPGAVEIAKLRLWLSLVVDEDDIKQIKPLPNLDYKIMQGNSLLEEFEGIKLFDEKLISVGNTDGVERLEVLRHKQDILQKEYLELHSQNELTQIKQAELSTELKKIQAQIKKCNQSEKTVTENVGLFDVHSEAKKKASELKRLHKEFFETTQKSKKDVIKKQIEQLEWGLIEATLKEQNKIFALKKLEEFKRSNTKPFFLWRLSFADVFEDKGGFDVVIGNPPYVGERGHKDLFREIKGGNLSRFYFGKMDIYYFFFHLGLNLLRDNGVLAFITTNAYLTARGGIKLRKDIKDRASIMSLINFNELRIFDSANNFTMITILQKSNKKGIAEITETQTKGLSNDKLNQILVHDDLSSKYAQIRHADLFSGDELYIKPFAKVSASTLESRINASASLIGEMFEVNAGIQTGADKVTEQHRIKYGINSKVGTGIFVLTDEEIVKLNLSPSIQRILKPWHNNSDITRWSPVTDISERVIYLDRNCASIDATLNLHLDSYREILKERREVKNSAIKWWQLQWPREERIFIGPKIIACKWSDYNSFSYTEEEWFASVNITFITYKQGKTDISLKYVLGLLNSRLYYYWLYYNGKRAGSRLMLDPKPIMDIPIKSLSAELQKPFVDLVDKILILTKTKGYLTSVEKQAKVHDLEHQIDEQVYKLYGLTDDEIKIVEAN